MRHLLILISFLFVIMLSCKSGVEEDPVKLSQSQVPYPKIIDDPVTLGLAGYAKVMCSAVFISGRNPDEAFRNSGYLFMPEELQDAPSYNIDYADSSVNVSLGDTLWRKAKYFGGQGCIICRDNKDALDFIPEKIISSLPPADQLPWPMGDAESSIPYPENVDSSKVREALDLAFYPEDALTAGMVILYKGQIIGERYGGGADRYTQLESWSMGKSLTATLVGRAIQQGYFTLEDKGLFEEWSSGGDPRSEISVLDMLQMSSGLKFTAHRDPGAENYTDYLDHFYIYSGGIDCYEFSVNRPLEFRIGAEGRYRNCDPLLLGRLIKHKLEEKDISYLQYPQKELFDMIGIRRQVLETDPYGNFLLTGFDYGTPRNWARLGQLYLQDGVWEGERILPEGYSHVVSTHAPGWKEPIYGGLFWLNGNKDFALPENTYYMAGAGGQYTFIVPDHDMVIVRMGHYRGSSVGTQSLNKALAKLMEAIN